MADRVTPEPSLTIAEVLRFEDPSARISRRSARWFDGAMAPRAKR